jgi:hypothetical protein
VYVFASFAVTSYSAACRFFLIHVAKYIRVPLWAMGFQVLAIAMSASIN